MSWQRVSAWIAAIVGIPGTVAVILWGVPYFLNHAVDTRFDDYVKTMPAVPVPSGIAQNGATINAVKDQLSSMEQRMIERDRIQAERDAVIMQYFADKASD